MEIEIKTALYQRMNKKTVMPAFLRMHSTVNMDVGYGC